MAINPVVIDCEKAYMSSNLVRLNAEGIRAAARLISSRIEAEEYIPSLWRANPLHFGPPDPLPITYKEILANDQARECLDWIFFVSALNFSFWSEVDEEERFGVEWFEEGWHAFQRKEGVNQKMKLWTGYWSLPAAINKALSQGIPLTSPSFYSCDIACSDSLLRTIFSPPSASIEPIPLMKERVQVLRNVGSVLCKKYNGSFAGLIESWINKEGENRTALGLVKLVVSEFDDFKDECMWDNRKTRFWKRAQILVAETWAAFHPSPSDPPVQHPLFPHPPGISQLTMFPDYRVPQILHTLNIITYPPSLTDKLTHHGNIPSGSREEVSLRSASVLAVEHLRKEMIKLRGGNGDDIPSVLIDFWLWDLAKKVEDGDKDGILNGIYIAGKEMIPVHRTRSIWY
ncbi:hypothetical protein FRC02_007702 [Tulasnella sp. 418]|nr:hypothetical protein FRC02_007702 [Tulasnella sp. 418]